MMEQVQSTAVVRVGIAEGAIAVSPQHIRTNGLGSCVGVVLYDAKAAVCGLVHVMLPESPNTTKKVSQTKFADLGVPWLRDRVIEAGALESRLQAKIAGGAQMFTIAGGSDLLRIGPRNVDAVTAALERLRIPLVAQDVGGSQGRTIEFDPDTSTLYIRTAMRGTVEL